LIRRIAILGVACCATLVAQQPNSPQAALVLDGQGGLVWPASIAVRNGLASSIAVSGGPNRPFAVCASATGLLAVGAVVTGGGTCDLPLAPAPIVVFDGFAQPTVFNTGSGSTWSLPVVIPSSVAVGSRHAFQAIVATPASPTGWTLSGATDVAVQQGPITTTFALGDDGVLPVPLPAGVAIPFYGTSYTSLFVCVNGFVTFGGPDSDFTPTEFEFNFGLPRLAPFWTDLVQGSGAVRAIVDASPPSGIPTVRIEWSGVSDFGGAGFTHDFAVDIDALGALTISWPVTNFASIYSTLIGMGPGYGLSQAGIKDLGTLRTQAPLGGVNESFYEWFGLASMPGYTPGVNRPYDLAGLALHFLPSGSGTTPASISTRYVMY
jgi:hypothetical protein